jgi:hypothetical protein
MFSPFLMRHAVQLGVELPVQEAVRGLLSHEAAHLVGPGRLLRGRQQRDALLHRVDEELLADREAHRQRVQVMGAKRLAAVPEPGKALGQVHAQAADRQAAGLGDGRQGGGCVHAPQGNGRARTGLLAFGVPGVARPGAAPRLGCGSGEAR